MGKKVTCPYCRLPAILIKDSSAIYRKNYGPVWMCRKCHARVGCHPGTTNPLGNLANRETREARNEAHRVFDFIWKSGKATRGDAYRWLMGVMGLHRRKCHIAMFDVAQCKQVVEACKSHPWISSSSKAPSPSATST